MRSNCCVDETIAKSSFPRAPKPSKGGGNMTNGRLIVKRLSSFLGPTVGVPTISTPHRRRTRASVPDGDVRRVGRLGKRLELGLCERVLDACFRRFTDGAA